MKRIIITVLSIVFSFLGYAQNIVMKPNSMLVIKEFTGDGFNSMQFKYDKKSGTPANLSIFIIDEESENLIRFYNKTEFYKGGITKLTFPTTNKKKYVIIFEYAVQPSGTTLYDTLFISKFKLK